MIPEPKKATDHPSRDGLVMHNGELVTVQIEEPRAAALDAGLRGKGAPMLLASLAAMGGGIPYLPSKVGRGRSYYRSEIAPTFDDRNPEQAAERIAKAEAKRARKWGGRC